MIWSSIVSEQVPALCVNETRLSVTKELTFPSVLTKQCGAVPGMVGRWHHLVLLSLEVVIPKLDPPGEITVKKFKTSEKAPRLWQILNT